MFKNRGDFGGQPGKGAADGITMGKAGRRCGNDLLLLIAVARAAMLAVPQEPAECELLP
jgi:hypothetical protein